MASLTNNPITNYFKTSYEELSKVAWPTRQEAVRHTLLVVGISLVMAAFFGIVDFALTFGLQRLLTK